MDKDVFHGDQAGIRQPGRGAGLQLEPGQELLIAGVAGVHHLDRHRPVQPGVQAAVDGGHPADGDGRLQQVAPVEQDPLQGAVDLADAHRSHRMAWPGTEGRPMSASELN